MQLQCTQNSQLNLETCNKITKSCFFVYNHMFGSVKSSRSYSVMAKMIEKNTAAARTISPYSSFTSQQRSLFYCCDLVEVL